MSTGRSGHMAVPPGYAYDFRVECPGCFDDAVGAVEDSLARHGFVVRAVHDLHATLAAKGFTIRPIRIYEVGVTGDLIASVMSSAGLRSDDVRIQRLLPCRVNVFIEDDLTVVTALRPTLMARVFPESELDEPAGALEEELIAVVTEASQGAA